MPSATIAVEHYNRIVRVLEKGPAGERRSEHPGDVLPGGGGTPNGINPIAEIPGTDLAGEVVIIGAHFDTTPGATGATDNATGSAAMMEAVRIIKSLGLKPRRTIRVALWGGEEQGLLGSRAYVAEHYGTDGAQAGSREAGRLFQPRQRHRPHSRHLGTRQPRRDGAVPAVDAAVKDLGVEIVAPRTVTATDHSSFDNAGLPGFQFVQERLEYNSRTHHSNMDFVDRVQRDELVQQAAVAAVFAWYTANWPEKLPRKSRKPATQWEFAAHRDASRFQHDQPKVC